MFTFVQKRRWYFLFSGILLLIGIVAMIYSIGNDRHVRCGRASISPAAPYWRCALSSPWRPRLYARCLPMRALADTAVQTVGDEQQVVIRTKELDVAAKQALETTLQERFGSVHTSCALRAWARDRPGDDSLCVLGHPGGIDRLLIFIAIAFRSVPNAFRYGVCAIAKMLHDVLFLIGFGSVMGLIAGWEVDSLFLTAVLTVVGFSVQDVIVVFDRIRENINRRRNEPFETTVNRSLLETLHRSLATQLNAMFVMVAIIFFGGVTIRQFIIAMLVGMVIGTYSSLFFAVPLLVVWEKGEVGQFFRRLSGKRATA